MICKYGLCFFCGVIFSVMSVSSATSADPWTGMQDLFPTTDNEKVPVKEKKVQRHDPWVELREYFLPFTEDQEKEALTSHKAALEISAKLHKRLYPFRGSIAQASELFDVPPEVIGAVIMVESSGNPKAKAKSSSAKGLMQTISSTFKMARVGLEKDGISITDSPYDAHSSIMAGAWYLGRMYDQAVRDGRIFQKDRKLVSGWKIPAQYYYAGPGHGKKARDIVITYSGGKRIVIDKPAYSKKVLRWANIMQTRKAL